MEFLNPFSLVGKTVLITGASSGIGKTTAIECSRLGARVIITGRNMKRLEETMSSLSGENHCMVPSLNLNSYNEVSFFIDELPCIDGVVYCAATQKTTPIKHIIDKDIRDLFDTNFFSIVNFNKELLTRKKINKGCSIVFISSTAASHVANIGNAMYASSKGAITSFAKILALELSSRSIRVNCVIPGMIRTEMLDKLSIDSDEINKDELNYPLGYGETKDVAYAIIYLLSNASKWITGTNLLLDGGLTLK